MATRLVQSAEMRSPVVVTGSHFARSRDFQKRGNSCVKLPNESSRAARALSGNYCSSSGCLSQTWRATVVPVVKSNEKWRVSAGSANSSSSSPSVADESFSGKTTYTLSVRKVQSPETDQNPVGRNSGSAIGSLPEDQDGDSNLATSESSPSSDIARPQPIVQGFVDGPFKEFAMDISATASAVGGAVGAGLAGVGAEFEAMTASLPMYEPKWIWFAKSAEQESMFIERAINAMIVGSAGIVALTKIFTVDHDYWHGWTIYEILQYAPVHNWFAYEELLKTHPVLAKMMISGTVYSVGDWIAQCYEGKSVLEFNRLRMLRSGLVGFCLHGSLSHFYYHFCEWLFPFQGWWVLPLKVGFDQTIWSGIWNSIYFITVGLLRLESPVNILKELRQTFFPLLSAGWKLWPFAHVITYGVVPVEQRLLWVDMVEILWVTILAMYSNERAEARIAEAEVTEEEKVVAIEAAAATISIDEVGPENHSS